MPKTTAHKNALLNLEYRNTDAANVGDATGLRGSSTAGSKHYSLHTASPGPTGDQTTNEVTVTGYSRQALARSAGGYDAAAAGVTASAADLEFGPVTVGDEEAMFWGEGSASSGAGTLHRYAHIGLTPKPMVCVDTSGNLIQSPGHGLSAGHRVTFFAAAGGSLPTGITEGTVYYVIAGGLTADVYAISTTEGGSAVDITAVGSGMGARVTPVPLSADLSSVLTFVAGNLTIRE